MSQVPRPVAAAVDQWLRTHHSVITTGHARLLGLSQAQIRGRIAAGHWLVVGRGVYLLAGAPRGPLTDHAVALAVAGGRSRISHQSAAWLWGWASQAPAAPHVTIPADRNCLVAGVIAHRSRRLQSPVSRRGLPCTPAERTLVDCAAASPVEQVHDLLDRSIAAGDVTVRSLLAAVAPGRPGRLPELHGVSALRAALERQGYLGVPRPSVLEGRMARILVATGAPAPRAELSWGPDRSYRLDFAYPERRLAVEVDGYAWHATPARMGRDQRRRNELGRAGWLVLVYTWRDVTEDAARVRDEVRTTYEARTPVP